MGNVSSGLTDGVLRAGCCVQRRPPVRCFNPALNLQLVKWENAQNKIEEVWLIQDTAGLSQGPQFELDRQAIVYNLSDASGSLTPLRLDWRPDGLAFMHPATTALCPLCN